MRPSDPRIVPLAASLALSPGPDALARGPTVELDPPAACGSEPVTATVRPPRNELAVAAGFSSANGLMFDVSAKRGARITGLGIFPRQAGSTFELYTRPGTHVGNEGSAAGWTLLDTVTGVPTGSPWVDPGFDFDLPVAAGETVAFYVTTSGDDGLAYQPVFSVGATLIDDEFLTVKRGVSVTYPFIETGWVAALRGAVLYEPEVVATTWNTGQTGRTIVRTPQRPELLAATLQLAGGDEVTGFAVLQRPDLAVAAAAAPATIPAGASSRLDATVTLERGLATPSEVTNNQNGAMFDLRATAAVRVFGFTVSTVEALGTADLQVYSKAGSHVGFEDRAADWNLVAEFDDVPAGEGRYLALPAPMTLAAGEVEALYVVRRDGDGRLRYGDGSAVGQVAASGDGLEILEGTGVVDLFGSTFTARVLSTVVHFERRDADGLAYDWSTGAATRSVDVTPVSTTRYSVDVSRSGCVAAGDVTVTVEGAVVPLILKDDFEG